MAGVRPAVPHRWRIALGVGGGPGRSTSAARSCRCGGRRADDEPQRADAIVVLGAAQYDGKPSPVLEARLDHALDLYQAGPCAD